MNTFHITDSELAALLGTDSYEVWRGSAGYDTRPYVKGRNAQNIPVAHRIEWADRPGEEVVPAGDIVGAIAALPVGAIVAIPAFSGCNFEGEDLWVRTQGGWVCNQDD